MSKKTNEPTAKSNALRIAEVTTRQANAKRDEWLMRRDKAIVIAHDQGASLREIGEAVDLSHAAIKKIIDRMVKEVA